MLPKSPAKQALALKKKTRADEEDAGPVATEETIRKSTEIDGNSSDSNNKGLSEAVNYVGFAAPVPLHLDDDKRPSSTVEATNWQDISNMCTTLKKNAPKPSPHPNHDLYIHLEQANQHYRYQIQIVSLTSSLFQGLPLHYQVTLN